MTAIPIVAFDFPDAERAMTLVQVLDERCRFYKVGSELFTASGSDIIQWLRDTGCDVFLDLKFHDIPNTVAGAMRNVAKMGVRLATVHASGKGCHCRQGSSDCNGGCHGIAPGNPSGAVRDMTKLSQWSQKTITTPSLVCAT